MEGSQSPVPNPYAAPQAPLADPQRAAGPALANPWVRLGAVILDSVIGSVMCYLPLVVTGFGAAIVAMSSGGAPQFTGAVLVGICIGLLGFIAWTVITIILVSRNGQTIGKKIVGIKVVRRDYSKASLGRIFWLRNFVNALLGIVPFYVIVDVLMIFSDSRQTLHDRIADTIVVEA